MRLAIIQARLGSTRMPGKVLEPLSGEPLILRIVDRVRRARSLDGLVVATSDHVADDRLTEVLEDAGVVVRRGPLEDVLGRYLRVIDEFNPTVVVRLTGDNPMVDPDVIDQITRAHDESGADYTSNSQCRSYPYGLDVEAADPAALRRLDRLQPPAAEREHVTMGLYRRPDLFSVHQVVQEEDHSDLRWTVDYPEDYAWANAVYEALYPTDPAFGQRMILDLIARRPDLRRLQADAPA